MSVPRSVPPAISQAIGRFGPIPFDEFMERALYGPEGFYTSGAGSGRQRDFLTSPEVGPLFGAVVARALDAWWDELGRPDPFTVVEAGAGTGALARAVLDAGPACAPALRYVLVERSDALREQAAQRVPVEPPRFVPGPVVVDPDEGAIAETGTGPVFTALADLPAEPFTGVVLANELLDNLAFGLFQRTARGWAEVRVGLGDGDELVEVLVGVPPDGAPAIDAPVGTRVPDQRAAGTWLRRALRAVDRGRVVLFDYAVDHTADASVRTYRAHGPGGEPVEHAGRQDVTADVCLDQLARVCPPDVDRTQAEFLAAHGLDELVAAARQQWLDAAAAPDLVALRARSRVNEAGALTDPAGLGAFRVLEWAR
jgi:SAM-dependent MidA family methyltransferase